MKKYDQHPIGACLPRMTDEEFRNLIDDIDRNGVREKIILFEGKILDGWHRYNACLELNVVNPPIIEYDGSDPGGYVISKNLYRRHLTGGLSGSQAAISAVEIAKKSGKYAEGAENIAAARRIGSTSKADEEAAKQAGVSTRTIRHARKVLDATDEVKQAVKEGRISVHDASKIAEKPVDEQIAAQKEKETPKPRKKKEPGEYEKLLDKYAQLEDDYDTLAGELKVAMQELSAVEALRENVQVQEIMKLHRELQSMTQSRDQWQNKCAELMKQINHMKKK